jgi:tRNA(fMet)-specific endonuclease VapC
MAGRILLDTNIVIALFAEDSSVRERVRQAEEVFLPSIVLGELYYGAQRSAKVQANLSRIDELAATVPVLPCDIDVAKQYGLIKNYLRARGRPLPENDIWVAAIARQHALFLASRDLHFKEIDGLQLESW